MFWHKSKYLIASGFILMLALMAALVAVGLTRMAAVHRHLDTITENYNVKTDIVFSMRHIARERALSTYAMFIMNDPFQREEEYQRFTNMAGEFIRLRDKLIQLGLSAEERKALDDVLAQVRAYQPLQSSLADRITHENLDGIREEIAGHDMLRQREMLARLDQLVDIQQRESQAAAAQASEEYRSASLTMIMLTVAAMVSALLMAGYIVRRVRLIESELAVEKEHAAITLHSVGDAVIAADAEGKVSYLNAAAEQMTGWRSEEARGQPLSQVYRIINQTTRKPLEHPAMLGVLDAVITNLDKQALLVSRSGKELSIEDTATPIRNSQGENVGAILVFRNVNEQRRMQSQLSWLASHDPLTGLPNRHEFEAVLERLLASAKAQDKRHVLLYLDLDQFKVINDTCGHVAGDELLRQISRFMRPLIRDSDTLARLGGDEFGILLEGCPLTQAEIIAHKLLQSLETFRFVWQERTFRAGASIGLVGIHAHSGSASTVLSAADGACYLAKEKGRHCVWIHQDGDSEIANRQGEMEWVSRIMQAFDENRFVLYFQRVISLAVTPEKHPFREVLIRLHDEKGNLVLPMAFLPAAERYGLMTTIDRWVVKTAFAWLASHPEDDGFAINLSAQSLSDDEFLGYVTEQFRTTQLSPRRVCFEITETAAIANWKQSTRFIAALREIGCLFALDDFGSGMSSFDYLKKLAVDFVKIDGSFVRGMAEDKVDYAMVEAVNRVGHVMGIRTTAEFVENDQILAKLRELGVDYAQGYGIHMPEPLEVMGPHAARSAVPAESDFLAPVIAAFHRPA